MLENEFALEIENPDIASLEIVNQEIANAEIVNPEIASPEIVILEIVNLEIVNFRAQGANRRRCYNRGLALVILAAGNLLGLITNTSLLYLDTNTLISIV